MAGAEGAEPRVVVAGVGTAVSQGGWAPGSPVQSRPVQIRRNSSVCSRQKVLSSLRAGCRLLLGTVPVG